MNYHPLVSSLLIAILVSACKVSIVVPPGGEVTTASGAYRCGANNTCTIDVSHTSFDETFSAVPASGYTFKGWRTGDGYFCGGSSQPCRLVTTGFTGNAGLMGVLLSDRVFYLEPVFQSTAKYRMSGTIKTLKSAAADGDVNDSVATNETNDTLATAQAIFNPITLGGHANEAYAGEAGQTYTSGDKDDYFLVDLFEGQKITLIVATPDEGDLDLYLFDSSGDIVDFSLETDYFETLTVPASGRYYVNVYAYSGASNYNLTIGQTTSTPTYRRGFNASADFETGHAMVKYRHQPSVSSASSQPAKTTAASSLPRRVALASANNKQSQSSARSDRTHRVHKQGRKFASALLEEKWQTLMQIKQLAARRDVRYAVPNFRRKPTAVPNDTYYSAQWHYPMINLPEAWDLTTGSSDVIVAVLDTGVLLNHPDMQGQLVAGYDFIVDTETSADGDGRDSNPDDPGDGEGSEPSSFHGTHVAGTIAAATNNQSGVAGVAWGSRIMPIRVLGKGGGYDSDILEGIKYAAGLPNASGQLPARKAAIVNMSLGGSDYSQAAQDVINQVVQAGVIVVAAAGNEGSDAPSYPASYDNVISVSAVGPDSQITGYSNYGAYIDVAAPGGDLEQDSNGDGWADGVLSPAGESEDDGISFNYVFYEGTSMAAPHVAGVIALMKSINPALTPADIDNLLRAGAMTVDRGATGRDDKYGYGLIDASKAVTAARDGEGGGNDAAPQLQVSPRELGLTAGQSQVLLVSNSGGGSIQINQVTARDNWLNVSALETDGNGLGRYHVRMSDNLPAGTYQTSIDVVSTVGTQRVPVLASVQSAEIGQAGVGTLYVLLTREDDRYTNAGQASIQADESGRYHFSFNDIPEGNYYLLAGTDMNNDYRICDAGEACGSYITIQAPVTVKLDRNRDDIDFAVSFESGITAQAASANPKKHAKGVAIARQLKTVNKAAGGK